ncbi:MAG: sodium:solute symporter [Bacteroidales bacterium]
MSPTIILVIILLYLALLYLVAHITSKNADNATFFIGRRKSPWYLVAFGMIGASISGITFISVPGWVGSSQFSYMQMVIGYLAGYAVIVYVLMPLYYRLNLTSIYTYLEHRFGPRAYLSGATFFLISRTVGSAFRLFISANVLYFIIFQHLGIPYWVTVVSMVLLIYLYTFKGGIRTVVYTDALQTLLLLLSLVSCLVVISQKLHFNFTEMISSIKNSEYSRIFFLDDWHDKRFFLKQFLSGAFIAIVMTGLDQDLMQKNLSCKNIHEAQKNMIWYSIALVPVNLLFLSLGALLYIFSAKTHFPLPAAADDLFPAIAMQPFMPSYFIIIFVLGLVSVTYSSADSALTALTTSFTLDILKAQRKGEAVLSKTRKIVHVVMAIILIILILIFRLINNQSVISALFTAAGYTYGPLLGLFAFGLLTRYQVNDKWVPWVTGAAPVVCLMLNYLFPNVFGFEMLIINGAITFLGLWLIRQ